MKRILPAVAFLLFLAPAVTPVGAASFDCARASMPDEKAVCANNGLSRADNDVANSYRTLLPLVKGDKLQKLVQRQRVWLKARAACGSDTSCLTTLYKKETGSLGVQLAATQKRIALKLFRQTGQCFACEFSGENFSGIKPSQTADNGLMNCTGNAIADGKFDGSKIDHASFVTCLTKEDSALASMSWNNASLRNVDFTGTNLGANSMDYADLTGANLTGAALYKVSMRGAKLRDAKLVRARSDQDLMSGACSNFAGADFTDANLEQAAICGVFLGTNLTSSNLRNAKITGYAAGIPQAESAEGAYDPSIPVPAKTPFGGKINLTDANLTGASIFTETTMKPGGYAFAILCRTVLPDGKTSNRDCR